MALFSCPRCGAEISTEAKKCPGCGLENPWTVKCEAHKIAYGTRTNGNKNPESISSAPSKSSSPDRAKTVYVIKEEEQSSGQSCGQSLMSMGCILTVFITIPGLLLLFTGF